MFSREEISSCLHYSDSSPAMATDSATTNTEQANYANTAKTLPARKYFSIDLRNHYNPLFLDNE